MSLRHENVQKPASRKIISLEPKLNSVITMVTIAISLFKVSLRIRFFEKDRMNYPSTYTAKILGVTPR